jgi:lantibiotic modifying enzyme
VHSGASGVGLFLSQVSRASGDPELLDLVGTAAQWVSHAVAAGPRRPPGLYFGLSGSIWFLAEAADLLGDPALCDRANELALAVPTSSFNPDITHGTAGIGLTQLHLWRLTRDTRFLERANLSAKTLIAGANTGPDGVSWPVPKDVESNFAGKTFYGYAHGIAGIAYFLLTAAAALDEPDYRDLGLDGLETLLRLAQLREDTANWDSTTEQSYAWPHWCNGAAGVGTALLRGYAITGDARYRRMAERAARAVLRMKWRMSLVQCHGLAGGAELLLDLHDVTGEQRFRDLARELAAVIYSQRVYDNGLIVFPDDSLAEVTASYNTGLAGIGSFLVRLLHGGERPLMADHLLHSAQAVRR